MKLPPYPRYKPSGVEWLGDVPEHWEVKRAKWSVVGCINGVWGDEPNGVDDLTCVRVADFDRDNFLVTDEPPTLRSIETSQLKTRQLRRGDLLIEKSGGGEKQLVGCVVHFNHDFRAVCSNFVARMPVVPELPPRYWCYVHAALYAGKLNYPAIKQTTGIQNLDSSAYLDTLAPFPHISEQRAIATFLDRETGRMDRLVAKNRELIERLREKRTALISRTVTRGLPPAAARAAGLPENPPLKPSGLDWLGDIPRHWEVTCLKYAAVRIVDCPHETPVYSTDGEFTVVRTADLISGILRLENLYHVDAEEYWRRVRRERVIAGDVLYGREGERWGFAAIAPNTPVVCLGQRMMQFRAAAHYLGRFLMWQLNGRSVYEQGAVDTMGSTAPHVNVETIRNYCLTEPPLPEQAAIAAYLDAETAKLDALTGKVEEAVERLQEYRAALITAAVTGKIDVRTTGSEEKTGGKIPIKIKMSL